MSHSESVDCEAVQRFLEPTAFMSSNLMVQYGTSVSACRVND